MANCTFWDHQRLWMNTISTSSTSSPALLKSSPSFRRVLALERVWRLSTKKLYWSTSKAKYLRFLDIPADPTSADTPADAADSKKLVSGELTNNINLAAGPDGLYFTGAHQGGCMKVTKSGHCLTLFQRGLADEISFCYSNGELYSSIESDQAHLYQSSSVGAYLNKVAPNSDYGGIVMTQLCGGPDGVFGIPNLKDSSSPHLYHYRRVPV